MREQIDLRSIKAEGSRFFMTTFQDSSLKITVAILRLKLQTEALVA
jgi:hypothetical protein